TGARKPSIDESPPSGNGLILLGWNVREAPKAKVGRSNRLGRASSSRAASVPVHIQGIHRAVL
ncbi:MAG: hypothetical protein WCF56_14010, partial [Pseudolabrys sp.]